MTTNLTKVTDEGRVAQLLGLLVTLAGLGWLWYELTEVPRILSEDGPILIRVQVKPVITTNLGVIQTWESNAVMPRQMRSVKTELAAS